MRVLALASICGLAVGAVVVALLLNRPAVFAAQNSLIARPAAASVENPDAAGQFGEVVALGLPALPDLAVSSSVLQAAADAVPGGPTADELASQVEVTLVPGAGVAKLTVRAGDPDQAGRLATALVGALVATDILQPAARLEPLDAEPQVVRVDTSIPTVGGIGLVAALVVGAATYAALRRIRPPGTDVHEVHTAMSRAGRPTVAILDGKDPALTDRLCALQRAGGLPLRIITIGPGQSDKADELRTAVNGRGVQLSSASTNSAPTSVVAVFDARSTRPDELTAVAAALPERSRMLAVVLT
ncbi:hypothetical protein [Pseudonocardia humida]|uniref:Capsular polysaccharide biosynthesis protein n=1 Tax=Pseudonocardia humida TaxID=2800819 RepID=A0ABT1A5F9_9PSEU|nr:hypothetical protein [Pseudonocardia humida]MCO1658239.1 hypothetical protein [Pseudonocardia humida]